MRCVVWSYWLGVCRGSDIVVGSGRDEVLTKEGWGFVDFGTLVQSFTSAHMTKDRTYTVVREFIGLKVSWKVFLVFGDEFQAVLRGFLFSVSDVSKLCKRSGVPTSDTMVLDLTVVDHLLFNVFNHFIDRDVIDR